MERDSFASQVRRHRYAPVWAPLLALCLAACDGADRKVVGAWTADLDVVVDLAVKDDPFGPVEVFRGSRSRWRAYLRDRIHSGLKNAGLLETVFVFREDGSLHVSEGGDGVAVVGDEHDAERIGQWHTDGDEIVLELDEEDGGTRVVRWRLENGVINAGLVWNDYFPLVLKRL